MYFSFFKFFTVSCHSPVPTVCVSHFSYFSVFLTIFQLLTCEFLIYFVSFFRNNPVPIVCVSHFPCFSVFSTCSRSYSVYFFHFFTFFSVSRHISGPITWVSFFHVGHFLRHIPGPTVYNSHFSPFKCFLPYFRS